MAHMCRQVTGLAAGCAGWVGVVVATVTNDWVRTCDYTVATCVRMDELGSRGLWAECVISPSLSHCVTLQQILTLPGLFPAILNLASNAMISSNATCGDPEPEVYCKLVEHVPGRTIKNPHCPKCDANSVLSKERHPITNAIDGTNQWWQSPSIKNGQQFHWITITLDLKQFYAISDSECLTRYNITPRLGPPTYKRDREVICTSYYSRLNPLEHGEIHTSLINGRPSADDLTSDLLNFTSARYIRLRLQRIRTLNADLMTLSAHDPRDIDPIVTRRYYYSIKDVSVGGMCICYGHAKSCPLDTVTKGFAGRQCDRCAFGYRDFPHCVRCECDLSGSINTDPCSPCTCKVNVMGAHCDLCKPGFYNLQEKNPLGCTNCFCFGVSDVCESSTWSTAQVFHGDAWLHPSQSHHIPTAVHSNDLILPGNTSSGHIHQLVLSWAAPASFLGNKLMSFGGYLNYDVVYDIPLDNEDHSLPAHSDIIIEGNGRALRLSPLLVLLLSPLAERSVALAMIPQRFVDDQTGDHVTRDDLLSVLAGMTSLRVRVHLNASADGPIRLSRVSLDVGNSQSVSGIQAVAVETCECPWGYSGTSCEGCTHNTTGSHCDQCLPGFYGDATEGTPSDCRMCPCPLTEPSNRCASGYYGNPQVVGGACVRCECNGNVDVSEVGHCDDITGDCLRCLGNTAGSHCESGFFGLQSGRGCSACNCQSGSSSESCDEDGRCQCVVGVGGDKCDHCSRGYYGFHGIGCTGLSRDCEEKGGLTRVPLLSYGGLLSYIITFYAEDGLGLSNQEPQVLMRGGILRKFVIYTDMVAPGNGVMTPHEIRMTEHKWKYFNSVSEKAVSHDDFMSVLSNVQISNITMETAVEAKLEQEPGVTGEVVRLIESCNCPPGHTGLSCQECAAGYFHRPQSELSSQSQKLMFVHPCVRCRCNNHSEICDTETGDCQDCQHHTAGRSCEFCAPGHYGNVSGSTSDCSLCACPLRDNSFSPTCASEGALGDFRCNACQTGYEGRYCESFLSSVCNVSQNSSRLVQIDSDITKRVDSAQQTVQSVQLLSEEGGAKQNISSAVLQRSRQINKTAEDLQLNVSMVTSRLGRVKESVLNSSFLILQPIRELQSISNGSTMSLQQAQLQAAAAHSGLQVALKQLQRLEDQLQDSSSVVENTIHTVRETNRLVTHTHAAANEAQRKLQEAEHHTERLMERIKPLSILGETLSRNLSDIRELIDQARRQAASVHKHTLTQIKVAVQADGDCVRSYKPQIQSSNFNTVSLILKTTSRQNLLFYLGSNITVDYLAIEMHDGKASLVWDLGSGSNRLEFPGLDITNNRWTRVNATRKYNTGVWYKITLQRNKRKGYLSIMAADQSSEKEVLEAESPGIASDLNRSDLDPIYIGGLPASRPIRRQVVSRSYVGCIKNVEIARSNFDLLRDAYGVRKGCVLKCVSEAEPTFLPSAAQFGSSKHSHMTFIINPNTFKKSVSVRLSVRSRASDGLILLLSDSKHMDFILLRLTGGRLMMSADLGKGPASISSSVAINDGDWHSVSAEVSRRLVTLSVDSSNPDSVTVKGNQLDVDDTLYLGGLPHTHATRRINVRSSVEFMFHTNSLINTSSDQ
ncbi:hypothetical protein F2P81_019758 [Scophthalmus maximus]|uniref:Laminin subunit alpha-1-like n=1 Tax=Scophthalmus maximus TaxID=52904 RepID=A0A6A4SC57_SCOMX|nr:hypothetical protein F2P81_019758 [Scophthalmus maximus]